MHRPNGCFRGARGAYITRSDEGARAPCKTATLALTGVVSALIFAERKQGPFYKKNNS